MSVARRATAVAAMLLLAACGGGGGSDPESPSPSPPLTTEPALTAPPSLTPEEQAEADIQATFEQLIAAWDDFKANASDFVDDAAADPAWNFALVESELRMLDEAQIEFLNSTNAFINSEVEQVGRTLIAAFDVHDVTFDQDRSARAHGNACLDLRGLSFVAYDGSPAELPAEPSSYQRWTLEVTFIPNREGWFLTKAAVEVTGACP
ncbi:hypothetical protein [Jiangella rhizosphaerae]|uniref:Nuclear transport factor 2 family protein n=1 Tax=Jiangella rhizosphaerae TaxID=2293569 RepID=A0A418KTX1_9ACTN|nr:hypothetical protein [Jiangella rhizosphaerae]RIQ29554.1 hypothetical protein DY240_08450 [Jiangella rhizosphaerae]